MFHCLNCGKELKDDLSFCTECGSKHVPCSNCGDKTLAEYPFCCNCGTSLLPEILEVSSTEISEILPLEAIKEDINERLLIVRTPSRPEIAGANFLVRVNLEAPRLSINNVHVRLLFDPEVLDLVKCYPKSAAFPGQTYFAVLPKGDRKTAKFYFKPKEICGYTRIRGDIVFEDPERKSHTEGFKEIVVNPCDYIKPKKLPFDKLVEAGGLTQTTMEFPFVGSPENIASAIFECMNTREVAYEDTNESIYSKSTGVALSGDPFLVAFLIDKLLKTINLTMYSPLEDMIVKIASNVEGLLEQMEQIGLKIDNLSALSLQQHQDLLGELQLHLELIPAHLAEELQKKGREEVAFLCKERSKDLIYVAGDLLDGGFFDEDGCMHVSLGGFRFGLTIRNFSPYPLTLQKLNFPHLRIQTIQTDDMKGTPGDHSAYVTDETSVLVLEPLVGEAFIDLHLLPLQERAVTLPSCTLLAGTEEYYVSSEKIEYFTHDHLILAKLSTQAKRYGKIAFKYSGVVARELLSSIL